MVDVKDFDRYIHHLKQIGGMIIITSRKRGIKNTDMPMYTVRSLELMNWLCHRGFTVMKVLDSDKNPQFKIFLFQDSEEVRNAVDSYLSEREV